MPHTTLIPLTPRLLFVFFLWFVSTILIAQEDSDSRTPVVWDLTDLYASEDNWQAAYDQIDASLPALAAHQDTLANSSSDLLAAMTAIADIYKDISRVYVYASTRNDEDQNLAESQERLAKARALYSKVGEATSWVEPTLLAKDESDIRAFLAQEPELAEYDHYIDNILRNKAHTLSAETENVLAAAGIVLNSPNEIYELLVNADIEWPTVTLSDSTEVYLNQATYVRYRAAENRDDRKLVFDTFWGKWDQFKDSLGMTLATEVNANTMTARVRNYPDTLTRELSAENLPSDIYTTLVAEVNTGLPTLHRYFKLRARMLGIEDLAYYDIYPSLVSSDKNFNLATSAELTLAALEPFGEEYLNHLKQGINANWVHAYPGKGKRSGAYMNGSAYDVHPYVLLNHNDDFNSLSTYAHEWGHAVHSLLANNAQPYSKADYSTFIAEMASQINEILLEEYMLENAETDEEKLFYLGQSLESMRGSFYRQTMFAEFEAEIHAAVEAGEPLTGTGLTERYLRLLKTYHGHDEGVLTINDVYANEWAYIPHFYYDFYVYQYATSIAGAAWFAEKIITNEEGISAAFIDVLKAGGSDYPHNILMRAGLDMSSPEPYRAAIARMNDVMDRMEAILDN
ncbi:MAG: oligoendopeptidase F [Proteobacteria bacterium]|jgi:oligoendopeptidase F|nr:oligoendopeptidase F [Pseudomonadota bacterium]